MASEAPVVYDKAVPNTLYGHPVSGNCLGAMCYIKDKGLGVGFSFMDILAGKQMADWYLALNPTHTVPTLCDADGKGVWESSVVLRKLATLAKDEISLSDKVSMALDFRQTTMYKFAAKIYLPYLFDPTADQMTIGEGVKGLKEKAEPILINYFLKGTKFIGGDVPTIADYSIIPVLTMLPPYLAKADERITKYIADFAKASVSWSTLSTSQAGFVNMVKEKRGVECPTFAPVMCYFPIAGRGELARLAAAAGGVELPETFCKEWKQKSLEAGFFGSLPFVNDGDNFSICQSAAVEQYVALSAPKFAGLSAQDRAKDTMFASCKEDLVQMCAKCIFGSEESKKAQLEGHKERLDKFYAVVDKLCPEEGFINGKKFPTVADLACVNMAMAVMPFNKSFEGIGGYDLSKFKKFSGVVERTKADAAVAKYLESTKTMAGHF